MHDTRQRASLTLIQTWHYILLYTHIFRHSMHLIRWTDRDIFIAYQPSVFTTVWLLYFFLLHLCFLLRSTLIFNIYRYTHTLLPNLKYKNMHCTNKILMLVCLYANFIMYIYFMSIQELNTLQRYAKPITPHLCALRYVFRLTSLTTVKYMQWLLLFALEIKREYALFRLCFLPFLLGQ